MAAPRLDVSFGVSPDDVSVTIDQGAGSGPLLPANQTVVNLLAAMVDLNDTLPLESIELKTDPPGAGQYMFSVALVDGREWTQVIVADHADPVVYAFGADGWRLSEAQLIESLRAYVTQLMFDWNVVGMKCLW